MCDGVTDADFDRVRALETLPLRVRVRECVASCEGIVRDSVWVREVVEVFDDVRVELTGELALCEMDHVTETIAVALGVSE